MLPERKNRTNQFAICWNGLIYPVTQVFGAADLREEITNAAPHGGFRFNDAAGEVQTVFFSNALSTRVLLLLRCGQSDTAVKLWTPNPRRQYMFNNAVSDDPYLEMASDWAWAMFDRVICAHMGGDETLALATARQLAEVQPKIEAEAARRGFRRQEDYANRGKQKPYLDFLEQLPQLLTDLERRQKEGPRAGILESSSVNIKNQSARIAALIHDLDLVHARQWGQPGWVNVADDPTVAKLIEEGDAAVEPLLTCLETDDRLTRSVGFGRNFFRNRTVISVKSAARTALQSILQATFNGGAPEIRAYWKKYGGMNLDERCYAILQDDTASARWLEAAEHIAPDQTPDGYTIVQPIPTSAQVASRGEVLRTRTNPSITDLMVRRATEIPVNNPNSYDLAASCEMALHLAVWDPDTARPVVETLIKRCGTVLKYSGTGQPNFGFGPPLGRWLTRLTLFAGKSGDSQVFEDYAAWIETTTPEQLGAFCLDDFEPLEKFYTNLVLQAAAQKLFAPTNAVWGKLPWKGIYGSNPASSDLVQIPAFRALLARELTNETVCGYVLWTAPNRVECQLTNGLNMSTGSVAAFPTGEQPSNGAKAELRWCDWIAWSLSTSKRVPFFNPLAPPQTRDEAIQKDRELLLMEH